MYDALIVGAGPAGSFAAESLARGGAKVALFDGRSPKEAKACGGGVTSKALKAWPHLLETAARTVNKVEIHGSTGKHVALKLTEPIAIYSRCALDSHQCERARKSGANVFTVGRISSIESDESSRSWTVKAKSGEQWKGKFLIGADGANSAIARRLSGALPNSEMEVAFGYRAPLPKNGEASTVIAFLPNLAGYAWAFPRLDHVSFGIATSQNVFNHGALDQLLWDFMAGYYLTAGDKQSSIWATGKHSKSGELRLGVIEKLRPVADSYAARIPGLSPETLASRRAAGDGWALLGDAAGFADPVTGEGIYYAFRSAEILAEAFLSGRSSDYEVMWRDDFGRELYRAAEMRRRFYGSLAGAPFTDRMINLAQVHIGVRQTLRELITGAQGYVDLKSVLARRAVWPL